MYRIAVDIGGTFTDIVLTDNKNTFSEKVLTTTINPELGAITGIQNVLKKSGISINKINTIIHGTTLAANSIIQRKGAKTAFITTNGFRDILEMQYEKRFDQYNLNIKLPKPLVPRDLRFTIKERCLASGRIIKKPKINEIKILAKKLVLLKIEAIAIGFLHSYINSENELFVKKLLRKFLPPKVTLCASHEVCPEAREYERFSTTVANSFVRPLIIRYLNSLETSLVKLGFIGKMFLISSDAGITTIFHSKKFPIRLVESGPAGGVALASHISKTLKENKSISLDIGGTTAKICYLKEGYAIKDRKFEIARSDISKKGSGLPLKIPAIDLLEIGAGGGSVAKIDNTGRIKIGPESMGANPGPSCYNRGGQKPTITDANLIIGRISEKTFSDNSITLDKKSSKKAIKKNIKKNLNFDSTEWAAIGVIEIAEEIMANSARTHGIENGKKIQDHTLIATGGGGPLHCIGIAKKLGIKKIIIPKMAGVGSALGFLYTQANYQLVKSILISLNDLNLKKTNSIVNQLISKAQNTIKATGLVQNNIQTTVTVEARYKGQGHQIRINLSKSLKTKDDLKELKNIFIKNYKKRYGFIMPKLPIEIVSLLVTCSEKDKKEGFKINNLINSKIYKKNMVKNKNVFDFSLNGWVNYKILDRENLNCGFKMKGPVLIEEKQTTSIIPKGWKFSIHQFGHLIIKKMNEG
ncbi:MAG: hydantoinase/oxoprolinase family protein [Paracoccaceae bacterium]